MRGAGQQGCAEAAARSRCPPAAEGLGLQSPVGCKTLSHMPWQEAVVEVTGFSRPATAQCKVVVRGPSYFNEALAPFHAGGWRRGRAIKGSSGAHLQMPSRLGLA